MASHARGYLLIGAAACCWGASATLGRAMFTGVVAHPVSPLILTETRISIAALLLLAVMAALRGRGILLPWPVAWRAVALGIVGMSASNYFYYLAIQRTNVAIAIVVQYTAPIWVLVYLVARGREAPSWWRSVAVALALAGIALVLGLGPGAGDLHLDTLGIAAATVAAFAFAYYNLAGEQLNRHADSNLISLYMLVGAMVFWFLVHPPWELWQAHYGAQEWEFFVAFSLLATLAPTLLYIGGLKYIDPARAVVTSCLEPVSGILLAALFLHEELTPTRWVGVGCVIGAIVLSARAPARRSRVSRLCSR